MKPLIFFECSLKNDNYEGTRARKNLKGALELCNVSYSSSVYDDTFNVAHFISLKDYKQYKQDLKENCKLVISLFYAEEDENAELFINKKEPYELTKTDVSLLNEFNLILVPSNECIDILKNDGVTTKIKKFSPGVNLVKYDLKSAYERYIAYKYLRTPEEVPLITINFKHSDDIAISRICDVARAFPNIKFIAISQSDRFSRKSKKLIKKATSNLTFSPVLENDIYCSLLVDSFVYLVVSSFKGNVFGCLEAMAANCQVLAIEGSTFSDIVVDKETGYVYNNVDSLKNGIEDCLNKKLIPTTTKAYQYAEENSLSINGPKLLDIYKKL
ncbi:MAG: glycosyltransferase [Bacilli bacterium]